jgi:hypothetical protein
LSVPFARFFVRYHRDIVVDLGPLNFVRN